jgi:regulator of ribosome biosynthesis
MSTLEKKNGVEADVNRSFNKQVDLGSLSIVDTGANNGFLTLDENKLLKLTKDNLAELYSMCFKHKSLNKASEDTEIDYDKPLNAITLPDSSIILPRSLPVPSQKKDLTRWENFQKEKGITKRKRSRLIVDETTGEYHPRWGKGSLKKTRIDNEWVIEDKPKYEGQNPFTYKKQENKIQVLKTQKNQLKNEDKFLGKKKARDTRLKNDQKISKNNFEIAQISTASMGRHDKLLRNETPINPLKRNKKRIIKSN